MIRVPIILVVAIAAIIAIFLGEGAYRAAIVTPQFLKELALSSEVQDGLRQVKDPPRHFAIADIGNALLPRCVSGPYGCFSWQRFGNVEKILALPPVPKFQSAVRVLHHCDSDDCASMDGGAFWIRAAAPSELAELSARTRIVDQCSEKKAGAYTALVCASVEMIDGSLATESFSIGEPCLDVLLPLSFDRSAAIANIEMNFVTGEWSAMPAIKKYMQ